LKNYLSARRMDGRMTPTLYFRVGRVIELRFTVERISESQSKAYSNGWLRTVACRAEYQIARCLPSTESAHHTDANQCSAVNHPRTPQGNQSNTAL
jgi:hypothetical protein